MEGLNRFRGKTETKRVLIEKKKSEKPIREDERGKERLPEVFFFMSLKRNSRHHFIKEKKQKKSAGR